MTSLTPNMTWIVCRIGPLIIRLFANHLNIYKLQDNKKQAKLRKELKIVSSAKDLAATVSMDFVDCKHCSGGGGGGGVLRKKIGYGWAALFPNPNPIYDQNLQFFFPYLRPKSAIFPTLFMTCLWPNQKSDTLFMTRYPISYQNGSKMAKTDTLFMTKTAEKPYSLGPNLPI